MRKSMIAAMGFALLGGCAAVAGAQPATPAPAAPTGPALQRRGPAGPAWQHRLGLSDEQAAQLRKMRLEGREQAIRRRADLAIARMQLREALDAPTVDEKLVASRVQAVNDLQAAAVRARVDRQLALRKLLTPEQRERLMQMRQQRGMRAFERGDRRGRGPARMEGRRGPRAFEDPAGPGR